MHSPDFEVVFVRFKMAHPVRDRTNNNKFHLLNLLLVVGGKFCACTNSNTNTYWCVRTVNATHNYLYCEFVSGTITYYDLNIDPYQLRNIYQTLSDQELNYMHKQLRVHMSYSGYDDFEGGQRMRRRLEGKPKGHKKHKNVFSKRYGEFVVP